MVHLLCLHLRSSCWQKILPHLSHIHGLEFFLTLLYLLPLCRRSSLCKKCRTAWQNRQFFSFCPAKTFSHIWQQKCLQSCGYLSVLQKIVQSSDNCPASVEKISQRLARLGWNIVDWAIKPQKHHLCLAVFLINCKTLSWNLAYPSVMDSQCSSMYVYHIV